MDPDTAHPNPYQDVSSWWSIFFSGGYSWRWFEKPHLYFRPLLEYVPPLGATTSFTAVDGVGREETYDRPFECCIDPFTGRIEKLYVQAPASICRLGTAAGGGNPNATWKRTPVRNVTPISLRIGNLPFRFVPAERRSDRSRFTPEDWLIVIGMWIPTIVIFLLSWTIADSRAADGKDEDKYLPFLYKGLKYPRIARNMLENREPVAQRLRLEGMECWNTEMALSSYRTFRPRFLNYLVPKERPDGRKTYESVLRAIGPDDRVPPFVVVAYSSAHYHIPQDGEVDDDDDLEALVAIATKAAVKHFGPLTGDLSRDGNERAFWIAANCLPPLVEVVGKNGEKRKATAAEKKLMANQDTYSISDIIRAADHVIIIAGNMARPWDPEALKVWGQRIWTLPEVILSRGDSVTVWHCGDRKAMSLSPVEIREIPKTLFPIQAWKDPWNARQLIEHYGNLRLSRLELVKIALECLMSRKFRSHSPGDRVYVLMGLLRIRPPVDKTDTAFQAFARLSLPQDNDRLMERLICLLPDTPEQNWELMKDQYKASLWDVHPETQICAVGENDTVVIDGAKGAQIQWSGFSKVRTLRRLTFKRWLFFKLLIWSPFIFMIGTVMIALTAPRRSSYSDAYWYGYPLYASANPVYQAGLAILLLTLFLLILPSPYFLWNLYSGKLWQVEPCFFGIEGYVPVEIIEEKLFGVRGRHRRLEWSAFGSPLSRHRQGQPVKERSVRYRYLKNEEDLQRSAPEIKIEAVDTYPIVPIDPTSPCLSCRSAASGGIYCDYHPTVARCQDMSRSPMGHLKVFTLVDTFNMTVTLFYAARPPTVLIMGGSEGGMKRAIACSFDMTTGTLYRETVLRIPSQSVDRMESLPRLRLGLTRPFLETDVRRTQPAAVAPVAVPVDNHFQDMQLQQLAPVATYR